MLKDPLTRDGRTAQTVGLPAQASAGDPYRVLAIRHIERVRSFRHHVAVYVVGMPLVAGIWALTEYFNADGWPQRLSDNGGQGTWNPWIFWVLVGWTIALAWHGLGTYFRKPASEQEIAREIERLKSAH